MVKVVYSKVEENDRIIYIKKIIVFRKEIAGDRIRIITYNRELIMLNGTGRLSNHGLYIGLDNEEAKGLKEAL